MRDLLPAKRLEGKAAPAPTTRGFAGRITPIGHWIGCAPGDAGYERRGWRLPGVHRLSRQEHPHPMKAKGVRCGVVGVGSLGQHHARIYASLPQSELVGVFDADQRRAAEIAGKHGCRAFASLDELGRACDAVSIAVPTNAHESTALELLANGCHLLIEKPLCTNLAEAERVLAAATAGDRLVQVGHIEHFNPVMSYLEKQANDPKYITAERLAPYSMRGTDVGVVLDLMIHDIGIVMALVKAPLRRIDSLGINVLSRTGTSPTRVSSSKAAASPISTPAASA
jgi:predicted dehydrogenase